MHAVESVVQISKFDLFPAKRGMILSHDAGQWQLHLPLSHTIMRVNNQYTHNHSVPVQLQYPSFHLQCSVQ